jgi:predicted RNase H-like nuclease (RuvC/YqgF family)
MTMDEYREKESEELKGSKRRKEVEMRKRAKGDIWNTRVKVGYSMPLWLKEKINKESLEQGLYQWEYIAKMIKRAENCPEDSNYEQLREENEQLKRENEQLKMKNEQLERENENLKAELEDWNELKMKIGYINNFLKRYDRILEKLIKLEQEEDVEFDFLSGMFIEGLWSVEDERKNIRKYIKFFEDLEKKYQV